jgi:hypothetical protein
MKTICIFLVLFVEFNILSQERSYSVISEKDEASQNIDLYKIKNHNEGALSFEIQSLTLLKSRKQFQVQSIRKLEMTDERIFITDISNTKLFIFDVKGEAINKIDVSMHDKRAWITDYSVYKDTIFIVDNERLFLFKFTTKGDFLSRELLTFNFEDFLVNADGLYFISKHEVNSQKNTVLINMFDHSLNLLKQYFITGKKNDLLIMPRFFLGEDDEVLFTVSANKEVFKLNRDSVFKFLEIENTEVIYSFAHANRFYSFIASRENKRPEESLWISYVKKDSKEGIRFKEFNSNDISIFLQNGIECGIYMDNFVSYLDLNNPHFQRSIPEMNWSHEHISIRKTFFEIIDQIDEKQHHVVVLYKIIDNAKL